MILEVAILSVRSGQQRNFERDFLQAGKYISSIRGYVNHSLRRCLEEPNKYLLLVDWENLDDHTVGFRQSAAYLQWKTLLHHYYDLFPTVLHFETIIDNRIEHP
jgi:heme-degrading monooxygenase HmoA